MPDQPSPYFTPNNSEFAAPGAMAALIAGTQRNNTQLATAAGDNMGRFANMMTDYADKQTAISNAGKSADYAVKANPDILSTMNIHPDAWQNLAPQDKAAAVAGYQRNQVISEGMQKMADIGAQMKLRQQQALDDQVSGGLTTAALADPNFAKDPAGALQRAAATAVASGAPTDAISRTFPRVIDSVARMATFGKDPSLNPTYTQDPKTGARALLYGREAIPTGIDPASLQANGGQGLPVTAPDGSLLGYNIPSAGKGKSTFLPVKSMSEDQKQTAILGHTKAMDGLATQIANATQMGATNTVQFLDKQMAQHQQIVNQLQGGKAPANQPAAPATTGNQANPADVQWLQQNPSPARIKQFEGTYGAGAASQFLP